MAETLTELDEKHHDRADQIFNMQLKRDERAKEIEEAHKAHKSAKAIKELDDKLKAATKDIDDKLVKQSTNRADFERRLQELAEQQNSGNPKEREKANKEIKAYNEYLAKVAKKAKEHLAKVAK